MGQKKTSANQFVQDLLGYSAGLCMNDEVWKLFGFKKRPLLGAILRFFKSKSVILKAEFLFKEVFYCSVANGISTIENENLNKRIASSISLHMFSDAPRRRSFYGELSYEDAVYQYALNIGEYIVGHTLSGTFSDHVRNNLSGSDSVFELVQVPQFCTSELLFMMKVWLHENYDTEQLIDDIDIDTHTVEDWMGKAAN